MGDPQPPPEPEPREGESKDKGVAPEGEEKKKKKKKKSKSKDTGEGKEAEDLKQSSEAVSPREDGVSEGPSLPASPSADAPKSGDGAQQQQQDAEGAGGAKEVVTPATAPEPSEQQQQQQEAGGAEKPRALDPSVAEGEQQQQQQEGGENPASPVDEKEGSERRKKKKRRSVDASLAQQQAQEDLEKQRELAATLETQVSQLQAELQESRSELDHIRGVSQGQAQDGERLESAKVSLEQDVARLTTSQEELQAEKAALLEARQAQDEAAQEQQRAHQALQESSAAAEQQAAQAAAEQHKTSAAEAAALREQVQALEDRLCQEAKAAAAAAEQHKEQAAAAAAEWEARLAQSEADGRAALAALQAQHAQQEAERSERLQRDRAQLKDALTSSVQEKRVVSPEVLEMLLADLGFKNKVDMPLTADSTSRRRLEEALFEGQCAARGPDAISDQIDHLLASQKPDDLWTQAGVFRRRGERLNESKALTLYLKQALSCSDRRMEAKAYRQLAHLFLDLKDYDQCQEWFDRLYRVSELQQDHDGKVRSAIGLGDVLALQGQHTKAAYYFSKAHQMSTLRHSYVKSAQALPTLKVPPCQARTPIEAQIQ